MTPWILIPAHVRRTRLRTALTVGSVAIAVFLFCLLRTVVTSIEATVSRASSTRVITSSAVSLFVNLPISMWDKIRAVEGSRAVTPRRFPPPAASRATARKSARARWPPPCCGLIELID